MSNGDLFGASWRRLNFSVPGEASGGALDRCLIPPDLMGYDISPAAEQKDHCTGPGRTAFHFCRPLVSRKVGEKVWSCPRQQFLSGFPAQRLGLVYAPLAGGGKHLRAIGAQNLAAESHLPVCHTR